MSGEPGGYHELNSYTLPEKAGEKLPLITVSADFDYLATFQIPVVAGRNFSKSFATDSAAAILLNETAVKQLGWTPAAAIGKELSTTDTIPVTRKVIGVVKDYHYSSLKEVIAPLAIIIRADYRVAAIRLAAGNPTPTLAAIQQVYTAVAPQYPFEYAFLDESFARLYKTETKQAQLTTVFSGVAILIACLGLLGLAAYTTEQRHKEISIRKVLGASVSGIVSLLTQDFIKLVLLANLLAWPLAFWAIHQWLQNFVFRIEVSVWFFLIPSFLVFAFALLIISAQTIKAAIANPVDSLRNE